MENNDKNNDNNVFKNYLSNEDFNNILTKWKILFNVLKKQLNDLDKITSSERIKLGLNHKVSELKEYVNEISMHRYLKLNDELLKAILDVANAYYQAKIPLLEPAKDRHLQDIRIYSFFINDKITQTFLKNHHLDYNKDNFYILHNQHEFFNEDIKDFVYLCTHTNEFCEDEDTILWECEDVKYVGLDKNSLEQWIRQAIITYENADLERLQKELIKLYIAEFKEQEETNKIRK